MKKLIVILIVCLFPLLGYSESVKPTYGVKTERRVDYAVIEGREYTDVIVQIDAAELGAYFVDGVKITVKDANNPKRKLYKKRFSNSLLYGFSDGTLQVGKGNVLTQLIIFKDYSGKWLMQIEEGGLY